MTGLQRGEPAYLRASLAMLAVGLATFNALYVTQALLPVLVDELSITPTTAAWTVSAATGALALCVVPASILSERFGRGTILLISALAATVVGLLLPLAPNAAMLITLRALQGALIAGTPAVAMTWLSEELAPKDLGRAMGLYIAGNTLGGLSGRLIPAGLIEFFDWRLALLATAAVALGFAVLTAILLPKQRRFRPRSIKPGVVFKAMLNHMKDPRLAGLYALAFIGMGLFVSIYNFVGFRMIEHFGLSPSLVGVVFVMYLSGTWSSAQAGTLTERWGRGAVLVSSTMLMLSGLLALLSNTLWIALLGLLVFTAAFFAMHSTASGWIGLIATTNRAEASSMYVFCYYAGSAVIGGFSGAVFGALPWTWFVATGAGLALAAAAVATWLKLKFELGYRGEL